jgi:hypothetical protein
MVNVWINVFLMTALDYSIWVKLSVWLGIGYAIYIFYGLKHSKAGKGPSEEKISLRADEI